MHQIDERTPIADLEALTRIYEGVIARYRDFAATAP
jgi:succinyl-diaminopimelate desuccinylase